MKKLIVACIIFCVLTSCQDPKKPMSVINTPPQTAVLEYKIKAQLGEGAFWNASSNEFYWIDIEGKMLHIYNPETKENRSFTTPSRPGTVVPAGDEEAIIGLEDGIYIINTLTGNIISRHSDIESDRTENRFNDGKCDPKGRLWVGSMHLDQNEPLASVYKIEADGQTTKMIDSVTISNGIVWTQDKKTMYYIDTPTGQIRAYDYDDPTGTISNERVAVVVDKAIGYPDGMTIDESDMLWVGLWNGNAVARFNPTTGQLMSKIEVPAHNVTACAFGGPNLDTLYITTASVDITPAEKQQFPDAGSLFKAVPGVKGVPSPLFILR